MTNKEYAAQIARDWNAKHSEDRLGYVTCFRIQRVFIERFERQVVGGRQHAEYWIPAEELSSLNENIVGKIEVIAKFEGNI